MNTANTRFLDTVNKNTFIEKIKGNPIKTVIFSLLLIFAAFILYKIFLKQLYYYTKYRIIDSSSIKYNKTLTNEIDLILTKYILEKSDNKMNIEEGIKKLSKEESDMINEIGDALCDFNKFKSDDTLKTNILSILNKHQPNLKNLKDQINKQINGKKFSKEENRLEKQKVTQSNQEDTKNFNRYLPVYKKNKGSSYGFIMKKTIAGAISKDTNKKYLESKYVKIHLYKQDFENKYEIAYGIAKNAFKENFNFGKFYLIFFNRYLQKKLNKENKDTINTANFDLQNASKNEYLIYKLFKIIDPDRYKELKERKIIGKKGIVVKLIPTINKKLSEANPKEIIKCLIESIIVELNDIIKSENYISTNYEFLNIDFGARITNTCIQEIIDNIISSNDISSLKKELEKIISTFFPKDLKRSDILNEVTEIIDTMHNSVEKITDEELNEILKEVFSKKKFNEMKKVCDNFYENEAGEEYKKFHPKKQSENYFQILDSQFIKNIENSK